jgi:hypothetical protein
MSSGRNCHATVFGDGVKCDVCDTVWEPEALFRCVREDKGWAHEGRKDDHGKDPWHLVPWDAVGAVVKVLEFGARKYEARNWEKGMAWSRPYAALMRHMTAWWEGEAKDPETGMSHLWHAGCCIFFLIAFERRGVGTDDRPQCETLDQYARRVQESMKTT